MQANDCELWIREAFDQIPWGSSPMLAGLCEHDGEGFMQRLRDMVLLPLLGYTSIREAEEDLPYQRDVLYEWLKLQGVDWLHMVEEITFTILFYWLEYGLNHDPSTLSRNRVRMIFDHTLIKRWGRTIADIANLYDHVSASYQWSHKLVVCLVTVGEDRFRFPLAVRLWSKTGEPSRTHSELAAQICDRVHERAQDRGLSLASVRVLADKDYFTKQMAAAVRRADMTLWSAPQPTQKFTWQARTITKADIESESFVLEWRQSSKLRRDHPLLDGRYARLTVHHPHMGSCVFAVEEYVDAGSHQVKRKVYVCTDPCADAVRVLEEARKKRWPIEPHFRQDKQTGSFQCYQGATQSAIHAHYACGAIRSILLEHLLKLSRRRPSLSQGRRMPNTSAVARYLSRNVRFDDVHKSEPFIRLRKGSLKKPTQKAPQRAIAAD